MAVRHHARLWKAEPRERLDAWQVMADLLVPVSDFTQLRTLFWYPLYWIVLAFWAMVLYPIWYAFRCNWPNWLFNLACLAAIAFIIWAVVTLWLRPTGNTYPGSGERDLYEWVVPEDQRVD